MGKLAVTSTVEVLAAALAAYNKNNQRIVRDFGSEGFIPNRQLITDYLNGNHDQLVVSDADREQAVEINTYLQQTIVMQNLKGKVDSFLNQLATLLTNSDLSHKNIGIVAWAPKLVQDYQKKDAIQVVSSQYEHNSRYIGRVGDKVTINFTLIEQRYIINMNCYSVYGVDSNNDLVFYWARDPSKVCNVGRIQGRVSRHKEDRYHNNAKVTTLNYVKMLTA